MNVLSIRIIIYYRSHPKHPKNSYHSTDCWKSSWSCWFVLSEITCVLILSRSIHSTSLWTGNWIFFYTILFLHPLIWMEELYQIWVYLYERNISLFPEELIICLFSARCYFLLWPVCLAVEGWLLSSSHWKLISSSIAAIICWIFCCSTGFYQSDESNKRQMHFCRFCVTDWLGSWWNSPKTNTSN